MTKKTTKRTPARKPVPSKSATKAIAEPPKRQEVAVAAAKGRPMLTWVGKRPLRRVTAFPAQLVESFNPLGEKGDWQNLLFHGDNKEVLAWLLANGFRGKVNLIYIDPPFDSGADYVRKVQLRGAAGLTKIDGETYTLGEQIQYTDIWANDNYLQFMYERLLLLKEMLSEDGSIALHCDAKRSHFLRMLLEEAFGSENFRGEIVVRAGVKNVQAQFEEMSSITLGSNTIFLFSKGTETRYPRLQAVSEEYEPGKWDTFWRGTDRPTMRYDLLGQKPDHGQWRWEEDRAKQAAANYVKYAERYQDRYPLDEYYLSELEQGRDIDFVRKSDDGVIQYYVPPRKYKLLSNVWLDLPYRGTETDFPTEKNEAIIHRLIDWLTERGDVTLDCFIGSGTMAAVAQKLGRRWIGCDINKGAIQVTSKRLQAIIRKQIETRRQGTLLESEKGEAPKPASLAFSVYRVNDYDLAIQHNEAVNLACEHLGVQRMRTDAYFDGTLGKRLVKIVPLAHPLTLLDLEELERELKSRPKEDRDVVLVCLGKEPAVDGWLAERTRHRSVNKIEVVELRTDKKYGKFFTHRPATARVEIKRVTGKIVVEIKDFISPSIVERLNMDQTLFKAQITDWRAMVDSVMIDTAYDGQVFNVALTDIPERKTDLVAGRYEVAAPAGPTTVAVRITDMLGEEVLISRRLE